MNEDFNKYWLGYTLFDEYHLTSNKTIEGSVKEVAMEAFNAGVDSILKPRSMREHPKDGQHVVLWIPILYDKSPMVTFGILDPEGEWSILCDPAILDKLGPPLAWSPFPWATVSQEHLNTVTDDSVVWYRENKDDS